MNNSRNKNEIGNPKSTPFVTIILFFYNNMGFPTAYTES